MWLFYALCSAVLLGLYDVSKKLSLRDNPVLPVIWASVAVSVGLLLPFFVFSHFAPATLYGTPFFVPVIDLHTHLLIFLKSIIVLISWIFAYYALKYLPITIASPLKATQPIWTVLGGLLILGERLGGWQLAGVTVTLMAFFVFSLVGRREGISFRHNRHIWSMLVAILAGATSALYDKFLMCHIEPMAVLAYYTVYQLVVMGVVTMIIWFPKRREHTRFTFRMPILLISVFLMCSDFIYFFALSQPEAMISVVSPIRRAGVIIPFLFGAVFMKDKNIRLKFLCLAGILAGILILFV